MHASPPSRLVALLVAARPDEGMVRTAIGAAEVVHEPDPLAALATLGCREIAARNRGVWGLGRAERFALVFGDDRPELAQLRRACETHLPAVELWQCRGDRLERLSAPVAEAMPRLEAPSRTSAADGANGDGGASPPRVVTAEEIRMLLGERIDDPSGDERGSRP